MATPQVATNLLESARQDWQTCRGQTWKVDGTPEAWDITEIGAPAPNVLTAVAEYSPAPELKRLRAMAVKDAYVVDVEALALNDIDVQAFAQQILDRLPN
ncbi:sensor domain-containing protein [Mycolicibacterium brumae]|uniref:Sensor domain-containing protein n=1 Tax=Mycolicibacterium brumae TaxID=85968 RepID=A0A2G5PDE2_9MYCO|nr:sensor domain-containing protein [Mycolicibacterium brumae]PIB76351.1 sensor domain-containing protein [Mycolicibacterium brumae]RWA15862.1 hypothetical protein MBRU_09945 [Mycolicibacterium brumae DSM 44177]